MTQKQQSTQEAVRAIYQYAGTLMKANVADADIYNKLVQQGVSGPAASVVINNLRKAKKKVARKDMLVGIGFALAGLIITISTYSHAAANHGGGTYVVAWGAIIFGALQFFRGLARWRT